jgi:uncharacterized damage-inducible protein DinB/predicted RNase H-like HicB family nuclease
MALYKLYLESGPAHKKTMVHVFDLLGCIATGPTTGEALARTPDAIRAYLRFLQHHGETLSPDEEIETQVAEHITEGNWMGNGSYDILFAPDLEPLAREDLEVYLRRLAWSRAEIRDLVSDLSEEQLEASPPGGGRPIKRILEHIFGAEYAYVRYFGKLDGVRGPGSNVQRSRDELLEWMDVLRTSEFKKLHSLNSQELAEPFTQGKTTRTARRILRRMLEHEWEHLVELQERLSVPR